MRDLKCSVYHTDNAVRLPCQDQPIW